jgi:hypothetical protein
MSESNIQLATRLKEEPLPTSEMSGPAGVRVESVESAFKILFPIRRMVRGRDSPPLSLSSEDMARLNIRCGQLDFNSGTSSSGESFIELLPVEKLNKFAREHHFENARQICRDPSAGNFYQAEDVMAVVSNYIDYYYSDEEEIVLDRSMWDNRE